MIDSSQPISLIEIISKLLKNLSYKRKRQLGFLSLFILISSVFEILTLASIQPFLEELEKSNTKDNLLNNNYSLFSEIFSNSQPSLISLLFIFIIFLITSAFFRLLTIYLINHFAASLGNELGSAAYSNSLYQPYEYHLKTNTSSIISTIVTKTSSLTDTIRYLMSFFSSIFIFLAIFLSLLKINFSITFIISFSFIIFYALLILFINKRIDNISKIKSNLVRQQTQALQEGLGFIRDIILDKCQSTFVKNFKWKDRKLRFIDAKSNFLESSPKYFLEVIGITILILAALFYSRNNPIKIIPILGTFAFGIQRLLPPLQQIYGSFVFIETHKYSTYNVLSLLQNERDKNLNINKKYKENFKNEIQFKNVFFKYNPNSNYILKDFDLTIKKGEKLGLIGKSGVGKSTILDLIMGLTKPSEGSITVDGKNMHESGFKIEGWYTQISHVPQNIFLSDQTLAENIAFGIDKNDIDMKKLKEAIKISQLDKLVENSENGLFSNVGERGMQISGGQRQRIGIARAIYKGGKILILDEATSALDINTEDSIMEFIKNLNKEYTLLIVSHRQNALKFCDRIIDIKEKIDNK